MKVSVIVPVYNVEDFLGRCLDSLTEQTYQDYEIICINDCSPDNSAEILNSYQDKYPDLIKVFHNQENMGLGKTREKALSLANGDYILFVDSDDYVKSDYISSYTRALKEDDYDIVIGGYIRDIAGKKTVHLLSDSVWSSVTYAIACAKLFKKSFIINNGLKFTGVSCGEDIYFSLSAYYCGARTKIIDYAGYYYYYNSNSITGSMDYKKNHEQIMSELFSTFLANYDLKALPEDNQRVIEYVYLANMINALFVFNRGCGIRLMKKKLEFARKDASEKFPNYESNPYIGLRKPKGQTLKIRLGVGVTMFLKKIHLDAIPFYLSALL